MIGRPVLNSNAWVQKPLHAGVVEPVGTGQFVPAKLNCVEPPPVIGSFGKLSPFESWKSKAKLKESVTRQFALKPSESRVFFCSLRCCSQPKSFCPPVISWM